VKKLIATTILATSILSLGGCATNTLPSSVAKAPVVDQDGEYVYRVGTGDILSIFVWDNPDISGEYSVRPDGRIGMALTSPIVAAGKTTDQIESDIFDALSEFINSPQVTVIVRQASGSMTEQVKLVGDATTPASLPYQKGMTLLDLMIAVGGLSPYADGNDATLIRVEGEKNISYKVRIQDLMDDADMSANVDLMPGDVVRISEAWF
jgi:polysaccharide export outer membrane protein